MRLLFKAKVLLGILGAAVLILAACAPAAQPAAAPAAQPAAPAAPQQPQAPAPAGAAAAPQQPAAPAPAAAPRAVEIKPKYGGHLIVPHNADWPHFDPHLNLSFTTQFRASLTYTRLVRKASEKDVYDVRIVPDVAESWTTSADGLEWTFRLRKGVKWAKAEPLNGRELTAEDVVYSFERALSPINIERGKYDALKTVQALDRYTVKFTLKRKDARFLEILAQNPAWIVPKDVIEKKGDLKNVGVGAGPFILDRSEKGVGTFYRKNPDYFDADKIYVDYHDIPMIPDRATAIAAFRSGQADVLGFWGINPTKKELENIMRTNPDTKSIKWLSFAVPTRIFIRFGAEPFADIRIRKALNHALDRDAMIKVLREGESQYQGFIASAFPGFTLSQEELKQYMRYDPALSRKLLAEAGFPNGLKTTIMWTKLFNATEIELYHQFFKEIGVELDLKTYDVDYPKWVTDIFGGNYPHLAAGGGGIDGALHNIFAFHHTKGDRNGPKSVSPKVDQLIDRAIGTLDIQEQQKLVKELQRVLFTEELWMLPCCDAMNYEAWQPWVMNYRPSASGTYSRDGYWYIWLNK